MHTQYTALESIQETEWNDYKVWNLAICNYYFAGRFENRPVYLQLDKDLINELHKENFENQENATDNFLNSIIKTLKYDLTSQAHAFERHLKLSESWSINRFEDAPPFIALLAMFTFVAEAMIADDDFSSNNYYGRMLTLLNINEKDRKKVEEGYRKCTEKLWSLTNKWIESWDGMLGYPTAKSIDKRIYVSVSISQALVREHDRRLMHGMFKDEELTPANNLQPSEMYGLMKYWLDNKHPNSTIAKLINKDKNIAEKVVEIAVDELQSWDGQIEENSQNKIASKIKLNLVAELRNNPLDEINLYLSTWTNEKILTDKNYVPAKDEESRFAFDELKETLTLKKLEGLNFLSLEPYSEIKIGNALLSKFNLESSNTKGPILYREENELNVLAYHNEDRLYKEVRHVPLMGRLIILCHESIATKVGEYLEKAATSGFKKHNASQMVGLPNNWILFSEVYIINSIETPGLNALIPLAERTIVLEGGIKLERDVWLTSSPPEIIIGETVLEDELFVYLEKELNFSEDSKKLFLVNFKNLTNIDLTNKNIIDGDYKIVVQKSDGEVVNKASIKFRTENAIRPAFKIEKEKIIHKISNKYFWGTISGEKLHREKESEESASSVQVNGAYIDGDFIYDENDFDYEISTINKINPGEENVEINHRIALLSDKKDIATSCISLGYHTWIAPYVEPVRRQQV